MLILDWVYILSFGFFFSGYMSGLSYYLDHRKAVWIVLTILEGKEQHRGDLIHEVNQIWPKLYDCLSMEKQISKIKAKLPFPLGPVATDSVSGSRLPDRQIPSPLVD